MRPVLNQGWRRARGLFPQHLGAWKLGCWGRESCRMLFRNLRLGPKVGVLRLGFQSQVQGARAGLKVRAGILGLRS